jgi:hypothetical protein
MSRRSHQTKSGFAVKSGSRCFNRRPRGLSSVDVNLRISRRIEIEIARRISDVLDVLARMRTEKFVVSRGSGLSPRPVRMTLFQHRNGPRDSGRSLRVSGRGIFNAMRVVKNDHGYESCNMFVSKRDWKLTGDALQMQDEVRRTQVAAKLVMTITTKGIKRKMRTFKLLIAVAWSLAMAGWLKAGPAPTAADVGDAETFGHSALYMGAASGFETLSPVGGCPAPTPTPSPVPNGDSFCDELNPAPAVTTFSHDNICRINLPKKASRNVIYPVLNVFLNYQLQNSTGVDQPQGLLFFTAGITIVSDALNGPDCIDQTTSAPCGGKLTLLFNYSFRDDRAMKSGDRQRLRETLVRAGNTGLTRQQFRDSFGLTAATVDALFAGAMTVQLDLSGSAKLVTDASITCNMRLFGD